MSVSGPPPNPHSRRTRRAGYGFTTLPAGGRTEPAPPYPLPPSGDGRDDRRAELWDALWATPQAALWQRHRWTLTQARYVECLLRWEADLAGASGALLAEVRQLEAALALSDAGLLRARAAIGDTASEGMGAVRHLAVVDLTDRTRPGADPLDEDALDERGPAC